MASFLQKVFDTLSVTNAAEEDRRQRERVYLLQQLKNSSKRVLSNSAVGENAGRIKSSDPFAETLCNDILACLLHGLKPNIKNGLWGIANKACKRILTKQQLLQQNGTNNSNISKEEPFLDSVQAISLLDFVKTPEGKSRAWIRQALNIKAMADIISILLKDAPLLGFSYEKFSLIRCPKGSQLFVSMVAPLGIFDFCFDVDLALFDHQNFPTLPAEVFSTQDNQKKTRSQSSRRKKGNSNNSMGNNSNLPLSDAEQAIQNKLWQRHTSEEQDNQSHINNTNFSSSTSTAFFNTMSMISRVAKNTAISLTKDASSAFDLVIDGFASSKRLQQACGFEVELSVLLRSPFHCRYARLDPRLGIPRIVEQCLQSLESGNGLDTTNLFHVPPTEADVLAMKEAYGSGRKIPTSIFSSHATAALLLSFLISIPDNLIPLVHRPPLIMCATQIEEISARNRNVSFRLQELPWGKQPILLNLILFFRKLMEIEHTVNNGLDIEKVSILFGKILFGVQYDAAHNNNNNNNNDFGNSDQNNKSNNEDNADENDLNRRRSISELIMTSKVYSDDEIETAKIILTGGEEIIRGLVKNQDNYQLQLKNKVEFLKLQYENQFTPFNSRNPQHVSCMRKFWQILFPLVILDKESIENHSEFSLFTGIWSRFGFRGSDPTIDLRGGGIFALEQLVYMCENYAEYFVKCLKWQYDTSVETPLDAYPIIITFIRVCRIANEIMKLHVVADKGNNNNDNNRNDKGKNNNVGFSVKHISAGPCWQLLDNGEVAIGELCSLAFMVFHKNWILDESHFVDYENALDSLQKHLSDSITKKNPGTVSELWALTGKNIESNRKKKKKTNDNIHIIGRSSRTNSKVSVPSETDEDGDGLESLKKREPTLHANEPGSPLLMDSYILEFSHVAKIVSNLPLQYREYSWKCAYSLVRDGKSYATLYKKIKGFQGSLLIIKDSGGHVFGGFARQPWSMNHEGYYGTGETFVFTLEPNINMYKWSEKNSLFMMLNDKAIAMGGGGSFAIYLDNNLYYGTSGNCETFNSPSLSSPISLLKNSDSLIKDSSSKFVCVDLEIWVFDV